MVETHDFANEDRRQFKTLDPEIEGAYEEDVDQAADDISYGGAGRITSATIEQSVPRPEPDVYNEGATS